VRAGRGCFRSSCRDQASAGPRLDRDQAAAAGLVCTTRMKRKVLSRIIGPALIVGGGLLMWLSPETLSGVLVMGSGIALELFGLAFRHG